MTTDYLYDGANIVQELNGATPTANLLTGGIDQFFSRTDDSGTQTPLTDGLGSTLALTEPSGALTTQYTYDPFGNTTTTGAATSNASQYTGRENDGTELYYYRARYYSPGLQRFISEDPIGFGGGDANLYAYVFNSPTNHTDSSGLAIDIIFDIIFIASDVYNLVTAGRKDRPMYAAMLGADVAAAFVPVATGAGQGVKYLYAGSKRTSQAALHSPGSPVNPNWGRATELSKNCTTKTMF